MSLLQRVAQRTPEIINDASIGAKELITAPNPDIMAASTTSTIGIGAIVLYGIVTILAGITIWQTIKLYKPQKYSHI